MSTLVTYSVNTTGEALRNNYNHNYLTSGWELAGSGPSGDREYVETWEFTTDMPSPVERMLDQEPCVLNYIEISKEEDAEPWWK